MNDYTVKAPFEIRSRIDLPPAVIRDGNLVICLPIPNAGVSPNARRGQSKFAAIRKSQMVKAHRTRARLVLGSALVEIGLEGMVPAGYTLAFFWATAHYRDDDNADGSCKAYRDGMADALRVNDRDFKKLRISTHEKDKRCPRVEVTIYVRPLAPADTQTPNENGQS